MHPCCKHGSTQPFGARMFDFDGLNGLLGTPELLERGRRYEGNDQISDAKKPGRASGENESDNGKDDFEDF